MGGTGCGDFQFRGRYTDLRPLVRALDESLALWVEREGKEAWRRAVAGFTAGREKITLRAAILCRREIRWSTAERQDSTERMPVGVAEKLFVVHLWTLCQEMLRRAMAPALCVKRSGPYSRMWATSHVASLWHRYGARPELGGLKRLMRAKAPWARASRCVK